MAIIKTADLIGTALNRAVRILVEKVDIGCPLHVPVAVEFLLMLEAGDPFFTPSTDWAQGGPIIERERVDVAWCEEGWYANMYWRGLDVIPAAAAGESFRCGGDGPTPLIAAMRCYVASRLGDEVDLPEELL